MTGRHAAPKKRRKDYEDDEFAKAAGRFILALERRASENPDALGYMLDLQDEMADAVNRAGARLHAEAGFSLGEITKFLAYAGRPVSRQAVIKRWGPSAVARRMGVPSITQKINERRSVIHEAAERAFGADELAARRAARTAEREAAAEAI